MKFYKLLLIGIVVISLIVVCGYNYFPISIEYHQISENIQSTVKAINPVCGKRTDKFTGRGVVKI